MLAGSPIGELVGLRFHRQPQVLRSHYREQSRWFGCGQPVDDRRGDGNGTDLFCDSKSVITGGSAIAGASTDNCGNLLPSDTESIP
jgi:hypothetical protein